MIHYLKNSEIDKTKWDHCIKNAPGGLIYGYSWYLDSIAENWDALVEDDYKSVFPLPWKKKFGLKYIYQPPFTQQLGLFTLINSDVRVFINAIPKKFVVVTQNLNFSNVLPGIQNYKLRHNQLLNINKPYADVYKSYERNLRETLKKTNKNNTEITDKVGNEALVTYSMEFYNSLKIQIPPEDYKRYIGLLNLAESKNMFGKEGLINAESGELLCVLGYFLSHDRVSLVIGGPKRESRGFFPMHVLVNHIIHKHSNNGYILDFEGSELPGVSFFNSRFGAYKETYYTISKKIFPFNLL